MNHRILIVDDDDDFRSLLSDLYTQAEYQVKSVGNPLDALRVLSEETFSLCVTDQSMPDLKGIDFIERCRESRPTLPIIMVSAYLSEDVVARLRTHRVEVFHKPLNIMSLLRKTSELIKNAHEDARDPADSHTGSMFSEEDSNSSVKAPVSLASRLRSFPFKSDASKRLKKEIEGIGSEMPNMVLVADEGTHFDKICEDISTVVDTENHHFMRFTNKKINVFDLSKAITDVPQNKTLVFALTEAQHMGLAHKQALMKLHKRTGPFVDVSNAIKFIFCLNEDLDTQFARGAIDQDFYLIMGQKEIYIPRLELCREDLPDLAKGIARELCDRHATAESFGGFSADATELLMQTEWPHNYASLEAVVAKALKLAQGSTITRDHLEKAIAAPEAPQHSEFSDIQPVVANIPSDPAGATSSGKDAERLSESVDSSRESALSSTRPSPRPTPTKLGEPMIQSFTMLEHEESLARSILSALSQR